MHSSQKRIALIVDDDAVFRSYATRILKRKFNFDTYEAGNGSEGLELIQEHKPDMVILDVRMPILDGFETLHAIRSDSQFANLIVIIATSSKDMDAFKRLAKFDPTDYILKPIDIENFIQRMSRVISSMPERRSAEDEENEGTTKDRAGILVVDKDETFRNFVGELLSDKFLVNSTQSGPDALALYLEHRPRIVLIGGELLLFNEKLLARKIKQGNFHKARVLYLQEPGGELNAPSENFDAIIHKTFIPDDFLKSFSDEALQTGISIDRWREVLAGAQTALENQMSPIVGFPIRFADSADLNLEDGSDIINATVQFVQTGGSSIISITLRGIDTDVQELRDLIIASFPSQDKLDGPGTLRHLLAVIEKISQGHVSEQEILLSKVDASAIPENAAEVVSFNRGMICNDKVVIQLTVRVLSGPMSAIS